MRCLKNGREELDRRSGTRRIASGFDITPHTVIEEDPIPFFSFLSCRYVSVCRD